MNEMSKLKYEAKHYASGRPDYPEQLYDFIASKTPSRDLAWDVGTGTGQAARSMASMYKHVIATDTSTSQLEYAVNLPNITYKSTPPIMSMVQLEQIVGSQSSVDLVAIATALHYFDLPSFYEQVKWILKKPNGVIAAWGYTLPEIDPMVDPLFHRVYSRAKEAGLKNWELAEKLVSEKYETIDFPFQPVNGLDHTGPFRFTSEKVMDLEGLLTFIKSWSNYQASKERGVELLTVDVIDEFKKAWGEDGKMQKVVTFPVYLRIGRVG